MAWIDAQDNPARGSADTASFAPMDLNAWQPHVEAMQAYHRGNPDAVIVVYDDYERDEAPVGYFFRGPDQFAAYERQALDLCRGRVLDVGAGSGCHSLELQERGFDVTAIEIAPELVQSCASGASNRPGLPPGWTSTRERSTPF
jgi:2-polyprenyl-3-methyl-5-hydroxy-6-metoxy-1,4-benzoquinol methylase